MEDASLAETALTDMADDEIKEVDLLVEDIAEEMAWWGLEVGSLRVGDGRVGAVMGGSQPLFAHTPSRGGS